MPTGFGVPILRWRRHVRPRESDLINALSYLSRLYPEVPLAALEVYIQDDGPGAISRPYVQLLSKACWNLHSALHCGAILGY